MPKTTTPGRVELNHDTFQANVVPDVFDARDLDYRPRLQPLQREVDRRPGDRHVLQQEGNSCTGHAVAAMVNTILGNQSDGTRVSPYMLYALARRYDEFEGDADVGSSLRGVLKGWYYHGVLPDTDWPSLTMATEPDLDLDQDIATLALRRPLGAFYRVNTTSLDDMQSAISELFSIVASASIHDGWYVPVVATRTGDGKRKSMHVITRTSASKAVGGHAFCIVGYNEVGFLVQNSWGAQWAKEGFATLPYDDWLESGYDAWVARPGVPSIVSRRVRSKLLGQTGSGLLEANGPDLRQLSGHVVNIGNGGLLSQNGKFVSTKRQIDEIFTRMAESHANWKSSPNRIVLYAHGGLKGEGAGLDIAQRQLNWWLRNQVYPITFAWQTGVTETLQNQLSDLVGRIIPAGALAFNAFEQVDRAIEKMAGRTLRWVWDEMKENAALAAADMAHDWRDLPDGELPGGSVVVARLRQYLDEHPDTPLEIHLVGHSAGSIFLTGLLRQLKAAKIPIESLTYLAAAIRTDEWMENVLPRLEQGDVRRFTAFGMNATRELDDVCGARGAEIYRKSLLYLVSRAFERATDRTSTEVPLVGMAHFADMAVGQTSYAQAVDSLEDGTLIWSPSAKPADSRSDCASHGGFDDDVATMTSVLLRILRSTEVQPENEFVPHLASGASAVAVIERPTEIADRPPEIITAEVHGEGHLGSDDPSGRNGGTTSAARPAVKGGASKDNRVIDAMVRDGWMVDWVDRSKPPN